MNTAITQPRQHTSHSARRTHRDRRARPGQPRLGRPRPTTLASSATTCTAPPHPGFTPSTANRIAQPTATSYIDSGLAAGTYYYKVVAEDASGNTGPASNEANAVASADTTPPSAPSGLTATGSSGQAALAWTAAADAGGIARYNVHRSTTSGFTPSTANRVAQPTGTAYTDTGLAPGTYFYKVTADDNAGNTGPASNEATGTISSATPTGLVGAWGFDAGSGTTAADQSGNGNTGTALGSHLVDDRQVRQRTLLQRHQRLRQRARFELARPHHRHDDRGLGQARGGRRTGRR